MLQSADRMTALPRTRHLKARTVLREIPLPHPDHRKLSHHRPSQNVLHQHQYLRSNHQRRQYQAPPTMFPPRFQLMDPHQ